MTATTPIGDIQLSQPGEGARYILGAATSVFPLFYNNNNPTTSRPAISIAADTTEVVNVSASEVTFTLTASNQPDNTTTDVGGAGE